MLNKLTTTMRMTKLMILLLVIQVAIHAQNTVNIIPQPVAIQAADGYFTIDASTKVVFNRSDKKTATAVAFLVSAIKERSGIDLSKTKKGKKSITFYLQPNSELGSEGYLLNVTAKDIEIKATSSAGIFYAIQSILQTLPAIRTNAPLAVPAMNVKDYPRFSWRGMHLDVSRHFFSTDVIKQYLDLMAMYKMNTFHWHLVDDQGWRIEIKKYPLLTKVGAWRVDKTLLNWRVRPQATPNEIPDYGGYYTQDQIREIVKYAAVRNITVVPEIEMPGHVASVFAAYPQLSCTKLAQLPLTGGDYTNVASNYCAGNDSTYQFIQNVLSEIIALFPSKFIHIGGDEVEKGPWKVCAKCQGKIKSEGLKSEEELQSYFIKRIEKFMIRKNRKMIGWDEILEGGLAPQAAVMSWRGETGGIEAAKMKHEVVMTPGKPCYFDHYQAGPDGEPAAIGGMNTLKRVYDYEPIPAVLSPEEAKYVMGAQANLWTEFVTSAEHVEYMVLPRMLALAEVVWSPPSTRNWPGFLGRLKPQFKAFDQLGLHYSKGNYVVDFKPELVGTKLNIALSTEMPEGDIFYTTDGTVPTGASLKYQTPIAVPATQVIKAIKIKDGVAMNNRPSELSVNVHKALGAEVKLSYPASQSYPANGKWTLTDGLTGKKESLSQHWLGFSGKDLVATVELNQATTASALTANFLQSYGQWIFLPQSVTLEVSADGVNFTEVQKYTTTILPTDRTNTKQEVRLDFPTQNVRAFRVSAKNLGICPAGHPAAGQSCWLFVDELILE